MSSTYAQVQMPVMVSSWETSEGRMYSVYFTLELFPGASQASYLAREVPGYTVPSVWRKDQGPMQITMNESAWVRMAIELFNAQAR